MSHLSCSAKGGGGAAVTEDASACVLLCFKVQVWSKPRGRPRWDSIPVLTELEVEQGFLLPLANGILCSALLQRTPGSPAFHPAVS